MSQPNLITANLVGYGMEHTMIPGHINHIIALSEAYDEPYKGVDVAEVYGTTSTDDPLEGLRELRDL